MKRLLIVMAVSVMLMLLAVILINNRVNSYSAGKTFNDVESVPNEYSVAIVLGAKVGRDGLPSHMLYDRVLTGVDLYKAGKARKLLISGGENEPAVMKTLALELGVPEADLIVDDQGTRTYESCSRARHVFGVDTAVVVTQDYHLSRSLYLCRSFGIDAIGLNAKRRDYTREGYNWKREYLSRVRAWYDINFRSTGINVS